MTVSESHTPDPLREVPPEDCFCDLVLNGGVASGVVYPWALLKLARHYRFKCIGGNSVGAMAAAIAAAAEYGRCNGVENAFEPLRRMPLKLAEEVRGQTGMLRLFQPGPGLHRLFDLFLAAVNEEEQEKEGAQAPSAPSLPVRALRIYGVWWPLVALAVAELTLSLALLLLALRGFAPEQGGAATSLSGHWGLWTLGLLAAAVLLLLWAARRVYRDLQRLADNSYGLCTGLGQAPGKEKEDGEGLVEWLHKGIQLSAGRRRDDPPLTFADLWAAPRFGRAGPGPLPGGLQPPEAGINLQMFSSNVTQGRPVRLPLNDDNTRLYYLPREWEAFFPPTVMRALEAASPPYRPTSGSDPEVDQPADAAQARLMAELRELPSGGMPIVVAARLSLSFPVLFSFVPVYAVDYEGRRFDGKQRNSRRLRRCWLSDGGLCTNFPIHLFDAAHPRWPTFGMLLEKRLRDHDKKAVWLPKDHLQGRADNWQRFVPGAEDEPGAPERKLLSQLLGLLGGVILTMKDWNDRVTGRLPQARNRIVRLALKPGEGQLNIAMPGARIRRMAHEYGTEAGQQLIDRFAPDGKGAKRAWREHLYMRSLIELRALRRHLRGYAQSVHAAGNTAPLSQVLADAVKAPPLATPVRSPWSHRRPRIPDPASGRLDAAEQQALERAAQAVQALEAELEACEARFGPYRPEPEPELRLRPPV